MFFVVKGKVVHVAEPKLIPRAGKPTLTMNEFSVMTEGGKVEPQILKVSSWHGFIPKVNEQIEIGVKVSATIFNNAAQLRAEVV